MSIISSARRGRIRRHLGRGAAILLSSAMVAAAGILALTAPAQAVPRLQLGQTAHLPHFDVAVLDAVMDPGYYGYVVKLRVCVTSQPAGSRHGKTRISWDPWTVTTDRGIHTPAVQEDPPPQTFPRPYDSQGWFANGQCATGWLPFWGLKATETVRSINYANSLGSRASWRQPRLVIAQQKTFEHFSVQVLRVTRRDGWYGIYARTCALALPPGNRETVRVSWDPWTLRTSHGTKAMGTVQKSSPFRRTYPHQIQIKAGRCVTGWLGSQIPSSTSVRTITYANSLGERTSWQAP